MNPKLIKQYRERFKAIKKIEEAENKKLSIQDKFNRLAAIFLSNIRPLINLDQERNKLSLKSNWAILKK